ncbi:hypothetical protein KRMM14A1259_49630 [Krasilnikovia sp. MM14-A1259]
MISGAGADSDAVGVAGTDGAADVVGTVADDDGTGAGPAAVPDPAPVSHAVASASVAVAAATDARILRTMIRGYPAGARPWT